MFKAFDTNCQIVLQECCTDVLFHQKCRKEKGQYKFDKMVREGRGEEMMEYLIYQEPVEKALV